MGDYPDYTTLMQIMGSDITVPIEIKAVTVTHIDVDIAAASVGNIGIDIKAAAIGNLTIDIETQSIGVYLQPDWQVKAGADKNLYGVATCPNNTYTKVLEYTVTSGKTFYICQWGFNAWGNGGAGAELVDEGTVLSENGGVVGGAQSFSKPIAVVSGHRIRVYLTQWSGASTVGAVSVGGYEI